MTGLLLRLQAGTHGCQYFLATLRSAQRTDPAAGSWPLAVRRVAPCMIWAATKASRKSGNRYEFDPGLRVA